MLAIARRNSLTNPSGRAHISHTKCSPKSNLRSVLEKLSSMNANQGHRSGWVPVPRKKRFSDVRVYRAQRIGAGAADSANLHIAEQEKKPTGRRSHACLRRGQP